VNCPRCTTAPLHEREREGLVVDVCPSCRGLWLDRGELEKLIARATRELDERPPRRDDPPWTENRYRHHDDDDRRRDPRRKRHWLESLGELFD
jgi:Zn-finger nucleic acid-binding protein